MHASHPAGRPPHAKKGVHASYRKFHLKKGRHRCAGLLGASLAGSPAAYSQQGIVTSSQQSAPSQQGSAAKTAPDASMRAKMASSFFMLILDLNWEKRRVTAISKGVARCL